MSWFAVDDRFCSHRKVMRMRTSPHYADAVALWVLAGSWCCQQDAERWTGRIPLDVLGQLGVPSWRDGLDLLVETGLWEIPDGESTQFHDWDDWNGIDGREYRSKEQARLRQEIHRRKKCESGDHDRHCPSATCPKKLAKQRVTPGHVTPGRDGPGLVGSSNEESNTKATAETDDSWREWSA